MKTYLKKLTDDEMRVLLSYKQPEEFLEDLEIFKFNEVPDCATLLVEGEISILKNDEAFLVITPGYVLGLKELLKGLPCNLRCQVRKNSKAIKFKKSDFEMTFEQQHPLHPIFHRFLQAGQV
jgi:CRP-like cAMP-binding protein